MESTKIQEFDLDPNCGFAKEETAQAIREDVQGVLGAVGNGVVPQFRSPVAIKNAYTQDKTEVTLTGTGKGKLFLALYSYGSTLNITIDGIKMWNTSFNFSVQCPVEIEFTESFSVSLKYAYVLAVFY